MMATEEVYPDGRRIFRDEDTGKIIKTILPPETARQMGEKGNAIRLSVTNEVDGILGELGLPLDSPTARNYAELFKRGNVQAGVQLVKLSRFGSDAAYPAAPLPGEKCPICGVYNTAGAWTDEAMSLIMSNILPYLPPRDDDEGVELLNMTLAEAAESERVRGPVTD